MKFTQTLLAAAAALGLAAAGAQAAEKIKVGFIYVGPVGDFGWSYEQELDDMRHLALRVNDFLSGLFAGIGIRLVDFKLEFGRQYHDDHTHLLVADEISPDTCRLWDLRTNERLDKDRFRRDLGNVVEAYQEVARRLGVLPSADVREIGLAAERE